MLNARITFGNIFAIDSEVAHVHRIQEDDRLTCVLDECIFHCPSGYSQIGNGNARAIFLLHFVLFSPLLSHHHHPTLRVSCSNRRSCSRRRRKETVQHGGRGRSVAVRHTAELDRCWNGKGGGMISWQLFIRVIESGPTGGHLGGTQGPETVTTRHSESRRWRRATAAKVCFSLSSVTTITVLFTFKRASRSRCSLTRSLCFLRISRE